MKFTWFKTGDHNAVCDVCGFKYKASQLTQRWDGLMVCEYDLEQRHPQELIRPIPDQSKLPWTRPEAQDTFIANNHGSVSVPAGSSSVTITDATITTSSLVNVTGQVPMDPDLIIDHVVVGSGSAVVYFSVNPLNATTLYYTLT